ncbi:transglycosylase SLT domain-containing protein [Terrisporobacter petrolearius]|uniref:transglycosylase SLT domain-containing protein n=1 Tax=Terrisporobacter petrolearius TaxID=1460447 RepID=UPI003EC10591
MEIKILDKNKKLKHILSSAEGDNIFFNDKYTSDLSTGAETFQTDTNLSDIEEGEYVLFEWNKKNKMLQIKSTEDVEHIDSTLKNIYSEFAGIELLNSYAREFKHEGNMTKLLGTILQGTNYEIGYVSPDVDAITAYYSISEPTAVYTILQNVITSYDNCEFEFDVDVIDCILGKYKFLINVYANGERGNKTYKRFEYNFNSYGMKRKGDITDFCSGLIGVGVNGITFKDIEWRPEDNPPLFKPMGDDFLIDPEAHEMLNNGGKVILGKYKSDATTPIDLLWDTYYKLQEIKQTKFDYDIPVYMTDEDYENTDVGDTVYVINDKFEPSVQLEARIGHLEISFTDRDKNKITLSNYKEVRSKIKNIDSNTIIKDTIDKITGFTGKLTQADIDRIREFLASLDIQSEEIEKLLKKYEDSLEDTVTEKTEIAEDSEDYRAIKLSKIDNGLWIGDNRIYGVKKNKCATITSKKTENTTTSSSSSASATEYKNAVAYYSKFSLGTRANWSCMSKLKSSSNKYKISTIVKYWSKKFGLDPELVYVIIYAESSGHPYCATKSSVGGYGLMQCERGAYFNRKQTIKFLDGTTKSFTPSYNTMRPGSGGKTTINGVKVDKNISNQIMFGCHEFRKSLERFQYNIFASLVGYNFGLGGADWVICKYVANKNNLTFIDSTLLSKQSSKVKDLYYKQLNTLKCEWSSLRKTYVSQKHAGTATNIEYYLRWYKVVDGQLPYVLDKKGKKRGYGANKTSTITSNPNTTIKTGVATAVRNKIVAKAKEIVNLHVKYKKATYNQTPRTVDDTKRVRWYGRHYGMTNPYVYDCSGLVSCSYLNAGLKSAYAGSCQYGTLVASATKKSGYKMFKLTKSSIEDAIAGDIIMFCNNKCPSSFTREQAIKKDFTHHTAIYCGKVNGKHMLAHASKWAHHPEAIRYESFDAYNNIFRIKDYRLWNYCFILRPWDLAKKDSEATKAPTSTTTNAPKVETNEVNLKGLNSAKPNDFYDDKTLITDITINGVEDDDKYPKTVSHVFCHFGINDLTDTGIENYKSLIKALMVKYPKKPIFIAKEFYVDSRYCTNWEEKNAEIANFNNAMLDFSNRTKYVIQVGVPAAILDSNKKYLSTTYSADGWTMKDKTACNAYYVAYKKAILVLSTAGNVSSSSTSANLSLHTENIYKYTKPMKKIEFRLPSKPDDSYYSRLIFTTNKNSEPTKYKQSELVYLQGTHCKKGQLIPKADTTYMLVIYYNPDTEISNKKYLGSVSAIHKGGSYAKFDKFKHANDLVNYAKSYYDKRANFVYNSTTPADFTNPAENISKWKTNGKMHIDDSSFLNYILMGWNYAGSPYGKNARTDNKKNSKCSWALPSTRNEANIAKYFVEQGWVLDGADLDKFTNLQAGDIVFMDADSINNGLFMGCSHTAIVKGKNSSGVWEVYECNNTSNIIEVNTIATLTKKNILFLGRIRVG